MTKTQLLTATLFLSTVVSSAFAQPVAQTADPVSHANEQAMDNYPKDGTLRIEYAAEINGLEGTATYTIDLATGRFIDELSAYPLSSTNGFDGKTPWMREISGVAVAQQGGDRLRV